MGAACCRCQQVAFEDDVLRFTSSAAVSLNASQLVSVVAAHSSTRRQRRRGNNPRTTASAMTQSLANYVSFPFPFAAKMKARRKARKPKTDDKADGRYGKGKGVLKHMVKVGGLGEHWQKNEDGTMSPLSLVDCCVRHICGQLVYDPTRLRSLSTSERNLALSSDAASVILEWLKCHNALSKEHFRDLARYLFQEWNLPGLVNVNSSWFDDMPVLPLQHIKSVNLSRCHNLETLGSDRWLHVDELPSLSTASFQGCTNLHKSVPDALQGSTRLTSLDLSGCRNIDDRSLIALRRLFRLKELSLAGCIQITDEGLKCLTGLCKLEKLVLSRCPKLSDDAFDCVEVAFPHLKQLDIAYCRVTDVAIAHIAHLTSLTRLVVRGCRQVTDIGLERLSSLTKLTYFDARHCDEVHSIRAEWTKMEILLLTRTAFAEADAAVLKHMEHMIELDVRSCRVLKRGFEFVSLLSKLKRLSMAETALGDAGLLKICKSVRGLVVLDISHTEITDSGTEGLCFLEDLEVLHMDTNGITNRAIANVSTLKKLRRLDLFGASITDNGLLHLTAMRSLEELEICSGSITDRGVDLISRIKTLRSLNLSQNRNINVKGLLSLQALSDLQHLNLSDTSISAISLRHLHPLKELESLSIYGCELSSTHVAMLQDALPKLRFLRCA
ncbi:hypothetical protein Poli38472_000942 [Pythium oligandrum]|uniref:F-box/LRR-repeat protein 15-like leucin rich repeat domain-containing protein n=1 Tax=Pythium oligandrum TaxID=41045 RepID=A0A8K1FET5_PYTOL|nr:hypothetical protein Poli38472_000942 [Pythium oligandrum]|eukprot:TMW60900.1 hypothetical protein Poli38472_000942 [Pythium oligandrum]